jgi:EAL domain-containing protein (putative c-di-GMP-specific phosphodiesterase class I)
LQQLVSFAHERKVRTIAPLVENAQTAAALWSAGVDFIQGDFVQEASADLDFDFSASAI